MRILRDVVLRTGPQVGEIAATAAGDANFFGKLAGVVDQHDLAATLSGDCRAHHAGGAGAYYCYVVVG